MIGRRALRGAYYALDGAEKGHEMDGLEEAWHWKKKESCRAKRVHGPEAPRLRV